MNRALTSPLPAILPELSMDSSRAGSDLRILTAGLARGDDEAWSRFHREYGPAIFRQLLAGTWGDHDLASEALQLTYLRVARHARPCDSEPMFKGWLRVVARSVLNDCLRKRRSFRHLLRFWQEQPVETPEETDAERHLAATLARAMQELADADRTLLEAKYYQGTPVRVLAVQLQLTEKAVESRLTRARAELRQRLHVLLARHE